MYYGGLDLGTSSVGWAVTDANYQLLRRKGKDLWGVRLFDEAKTSQERRTFRTSRRRREREKARIGMLKEYFAEEIEKTDAGFYHRLDESKYHLEDKDIKDKFNIFVDDKYTDKEYFKQYPTIFHLRKELLESEEPHDVRLVYLAILNLFKHRGNFLNESMSGEEKEEKIEDLYLSLCKAMETVFETTFPENIDCREIEEILSNRDDSKSEKAEKLEKLLNVSKSKDKAAYEIIRMMCGLSGKLSNIWDKEILGEEYGKKQVSFRDSSYEEHLVNLTEVLSEEELEILEYAKQIHDKGLLSHILKGHTYLSEARVEAYNKHKEDLEKLRIVIKKYCKEEYNSYFRVMSDNNYSGYIGSVNSDKEKSSNHGKKRRNHEAKKENYKAFWNETKRLLNRMPESDEMVWYLKKELEKESLLPKQLTCENGVIPNQVHLIELKKILSNAQNYLKFLGEKDESGFTVAERIIKLFEFRVPYYVGPLHIEVGEEGNKWVVRKEAGKVLPWNLEEKVDLEETRKEFISRMVKHCTYLNGEKVLPKSSLLYEKFMVLNELNNVKIYGEKLSTELKQKIYIELFQKGKKVKLEQFVQFLQLNGLLKPGEKDAISGIDNGFQNSLVSYGRFYSVIGEKINEWEMEKMAESIIFYGTIFSNDKKMMKEWLEEEYGEQSEKKYLTAEQIKRILGFKWKDWGRLSKEFLELPGNVCGFPEEMSLINAMWNTQNNLMELLSSNYTFIENLNKRIEKKEKLLKEFSYKDLEDSYLSAPVKRMAWQTILILKELAQVTGEQPKKLFIEMPRSEGVKNKRTISRKKKLEELYKKCQEDGKQWLKEIADLSEDELRSKKLYLYYMQKGRCMYTGNRISLEDLLNNNLKYDIDHIYPRHYVKDDSLENNLVLVEKESNGHKSDTFPIENTVQNVRLGFWKELLNGNFLTREKFHRLTRKTEFTEEELAGFINRQIVETGQATKYVAQILGELLPETEIVYVKAGNVSDFRRKMDILKARSLNDFHHAHDAYLNIVVGNTYHTKFTKSPINFIEEYRRKGEKYHMDKIFQYDVCRNGEMAWKAGDNGTIWIVKKMIGKNTPLVTRRTYETHGGFTKQTIHPAEKVRGGNINSYLPVKLQDERANDVTKYGGFTDIAGAYYFLVEHDKKKKKVRTLEQIPIYLKDKFKKDVSELENYCRERLGYVNPEIKMVKIPMRSLVKRNGYFMYLGGKTGVQILGYNAVQLCMSDKWCNYIHKLEKFKEKGKEEDRRKDTNERILEERNCELYQELLRKHNEAIYKNKPNPLGTKLIDKQETFNKLGLKEQVNVLLELLKATQSQNFNIQAKEIDLKASPIKFSNEVSEQDEFLLINQSITGIYQSVIDLRTV